MPRRSWEGKGGVMREIEVEGVEIDERMSEG
jgi:hypothetical protein